MKLHAVLEMFDNPANIRWIADSNVEKTAIAMIGDEEFIASFVPFGYSHKDMPQNIKSWTMSFVPKSTKADYHTGQGHALQFTSTLYHIIDDAFSTKGIDGLFIEARKSPSRIGMFKRLLKRIADKHSLTLYDEGEEFKHFWWYAR